MLTLHIYCTFESQCYWLYLCSNYNFNFSYMYFLNCTHFKCSWTLAVHMKLFTLMIITPWLWHMHMHTICIILLLPLECFKYVSPFCIYIFHLTAIDYATCLYIKMTQSSGNVFNITESHIVGTMWVSINWIMVRWLFNYLLKVFLYRST